MLRLASDQVNAWLYSGAWWPFGLKLALTVLSVAPEVVGLSLVALDATEERRRAAAIKSEADTRVGVATA